jgi:heme/copper-type cytochrome/quinol oxidase subunit 3
VTVLTAPVPAPAPAVGKVRGTAWWGMMSLIATEAMIFAGLLGSYFFVRASAKEWPLGGIDAPELGRIAVFTVVLLASSAPIFWAEAGVRRGRLGQLRIGLLLSFLLGAVFLVNQALEYRELTFGLRDNAYGSLFYGITGLHGLHVLIGLLMSLIVQIKAWTGRITPERHVTLQVFAMYWHFVDVVWIFVFSSLYLSPHLR